MAEHKSASKIFQATALIIAAFGCNCATAATDAPAHRKHDLERLGQQLFFDASLSLDGKVSCSTCHNPATAFSNARSVAIGTLQRTGTRNAPSLLNVGKAPFFWDGRANSLQTVVLQPFSNPVEMGLDSQAELINRIRNESRYRAEIERLLPGTANSDRVDAIAEALTTYVRSLRKGSNLYDHFVSLHDPNALTPGQQHGLALFRGAAGCAECHQLTGSPAMFTDDTFHSTLISPHIAPLLPEAAIEIVNADLDTTTLNARIESDATMSALGRFVVTHDPKDIGAFRTPSLRNVAETAPYMHDGSVRTLREAVDQEIYYRNLQTNRPNTLTEQDRRDLVAFLESLTDARLSAPKERPPP